MTFLTSPSFIKVRDCVGSEEHMCGCEGVRVGICVGGGREGGIGV